MAQCGLVRCPYRFALCRERGDGHRVASQSIVDDAASVQPVLVDQSTLQVLVAFPQEHQGLQRRVMIHVAQHQFRLRQVIPQRILISVFQGFVFGRRNDALGAVERVHPNLRSEQAQLHHLLQMKWQVLKGLLAVQKGWDFVRSVSGHIWRIGGRMGCVVLEECASLGARMLVVVLDVPVSCIIVLGLLLCVLSLLVLVRVVVLHLRRWSLQVITCCRRLSVIPIVGW
mmetsp:Transcript_11700/g.33728  ORF Transcript_11700/g.33728 Transcript_11700/m.33728 type:complete len:228 (-) Transcript_11700:284-967(-)